MAEGGILPFIWRLHCCDEGTRLEIGELINVPAASSRGVCVVEKRNEASIYVMIDIGASSK